MSKRASLVRGLVALAVLGALASAMIVAPAGAHVTRKFGHLKKHINQIATKQANQVFDSKIGPATAPFQAKSDLLFAVVTNAGSATAALVRSRGATGVGAFFVTDVSFNRAVNNCAWTATAEEGVNNTTNAIAELGGDNNTIRVTLTDDAGGLVLGAGETFHLVVVC
jgi:hypothetical protein